MHSENVKYSYESTEAFRRREAEQGAESGPGRFADGPAYVPRFARSAGIARI